MKLKTTATTFSLIGFLWAFFSIQSYAQTAPPHLKHFGFVAIDCFYDDPLDTDTITNYISEVDTFSNLAHMCVFNYTDNIVARVDLMNAHCVKPALHIQGVFFRIVDTLAPSGANWDLYPDFTARWTTFLATNSSVLVPSKIACFYIADEPFWNGISLLDMDTVCALLKNACPDIPILMVEAYTMVNSMQVPQAMDWVGFNRYAIFDPQSDSRFLENLDTVRSKLSSPNQKLVLIIDDQWLPFYGAAGYPPDTMKYVVQNYYNLAVSDTNIIGLIGYLWPGGLDDPGQLGVRNMPQSVIDINVEIGMMIKANNSPCNTTGIEDREHIKWDFTIYPNPAKEILSITISFETINAEIKIYNLLGQIEKRISNINSRTINIETHDLANGIYIIVLQNGGKQASKKFIINK